MATNGFGGNVGTAWIGWAWVRSDGIGLPTGRAMANGSTACLITAIGGYVVGRGATRAISLQLGSASTAGFNVGAGSHPPAFTGYRSVSPWLVNGGSASFYIYMGNLTVNFGRSSTSGGTNTYGSDGSTWSGTLGGAYEYVQAPSAPRTLSVVPGGVGEADLTWLAPSSDGESGLTGYTAQWSLSPTFASGVTSVNIGTGLTHTFTGLPPSTVYFRVAARNAVTAAAGTTSVFSNTASAQIATVPDAPTGLAGVPSARGGYITFVAPADDGGVPVLDYDLQVDDNGSFTSPDTYVIPTSLLAKQVSNLTPGTTGYARVLARNAVGDSSWSSTATFVVPAATYQDNVGMASVSLPDGMQVDLRSSGGSTPTITLAYSNDTQGVTATTLATLSTGTSAGQFATPNTLDGLALTADSSGNLYVVGRDGSTGGVLIKRYVRNSTTSWSLSGSLSQTLADTGDLLVQFAAVWVPGTGGSPIPSLLVLARRAGQTSTGNLSYATVNLTTLAASTGTLFIASGSDPAFLSNPGSGTPNLGRIDLTRLTSSGIRVAVLANGFAVLDVTNGVVSSVSKSANGTVLDTIKGRVVPIDSSSFAHLSSSAGALTVRFYTTAGAVNNTTTFASGMAQTPGFTDNWDAYYNRQSGLLVIDYVADDSGRKIEQVTVNATTYVTGAATVLTSTQGPASSVNSKVKVPHGLVDERKVLLTSAAVVSGTQSLASLSDVSGNVAPTAPSLNGRAVFDANTAADFGWTFGDPNTLDTQTAFQMQIDNLTGPTSAFDSGKVSSTNATYTLSAGAITDNESYRWRVRTYDVLDQVGAWSSYSTFITSDSGYVTITDPASDNPTSNVDYESITWTYTTTGSATQAKVRIRVLNNATLAVLQDTGWLVTSDQTYLLTGLASSIEQRVEVSVESTDGLLATPGTRLLTPVFDEPVPPTFTLTVATSYIEVNITNPTSGSQPPVTVNQVWRSVSTDEEYEMVGTTGPDSIYRDYAVASGVTYDYFIRGVSD